MNIGGAGYGWIALRIVSLSYRQNYVTKEKCSLTMLSWTIKVFYIYIGCSERLCQVALDIGIFE